MRPTDVSAGEIGHSARRLEINIRLETNVPLIGYAGPSGGPSARFVGWLGLLRVLSEAVGLDPLPRGVGEFASGRQTELEEDVGNVGLDGSA